MAIAPASGGTIPQVTDNTLISAPPNGNALVVQTANNNRARGMSDAPTTSQQVHRPRKYRRGTSRRGVAVNMGVSGPGFTALDQRISRLDSAYDQLPNKAAWMTYAGLMSGHWSLCANCQPDFGAKKLFRQINFNRLQLGLALQTVPPGSASFVSNVALVTVYIDDTLNHEAQFDCSPTLPTSWYAVPSIGMSLSNPSVQLFIADRRAHQLLTSAFAAWMRAINAVVGFPNDGNTHSVQLPICYYLPDGSPGHREFFTFQWRAV